MWRPDGWDPDVRLGVLTPHADVGPESELRAMAPASIGIHASRVPFGAMHAGGRMDPTIPLGPVRAFVAPPAIDRACAVLAAAPVQAIGIGFTSSSYVIGARAEDEVNRRLAQQAGTPVTSTCASAVKALRALAVDGIALFHPPWFDRELDELGAHYFARAGFAIVLHEVCGLVSDQRAITREAVAEWMGQRTPDDAGAVLVGGNGFRAVGVIEELEARLGRPVLTANQVLLWDLLRAAGAPVHVSGYGRLLQVA